jgi:hypothetical protein
LEEKKARLDGQEQDLILREEALSEARTRGLDPVERQEELVELVELRQRLEETRLARGAEAARLARIVGDMSGALVNLGMAPVPEIPQLPDKADDVLRAAGVVVERLKDAADNGFGLWD